MHPKVGEVLSAISKDYFKGYEEVSENHLQVATQLTELFAHETYFRFDICSDVLRFEIRHYLGFLDDGCDLDDIIDVLRENDRTFGTTSCYACIQTIEGTHYVSLQNNHAFLMKWESTDIADMIDLQFHDLKNSAFFLFKTDPPIAPSIRVFGPKNPRFG